MKATEWEIYLKRGEEELVLAKTLFKLSHNEEKAKEAFLLAVISHSYYCIFYLTKSYLLTKGKKTRAPEEHKKTFELLREYVNSGTLTQELKSISSSLSAEELHSICLKEKKKRAQFTYKILLSREEEGANESLERASLVFKSLYLIVIKG